MLISITNINKFNRIFKIIKYTRKYKKNVKYISIHTRRNLNKNTKHENKE